MGILSRQLRRQAGGGPFAHLDRMVCRSFRTSWSSRIHSTCCSSSRMIGRLRDVLRQWETIASPICRAMSATSQGLPAMSSRVRADCGVGTPRRPYAPTPVSPYPPSPLHPRPLPGVCVSVPVEYPQVREPPPNKDPSPVVNVQPVIVDRRDQLTQRDVTLVGRYGPQRVHSQLALEQTDYQTGMSPLPLPRKEVRILLSESNESGEVSIWRGRGRVPLFPLPRSRNRLTF